MAPGSLRQVVVLCLLSTAAACAPASGPSGPEPQASEATAAFVDVAGPAGIDFRHRSGAAGQYLLPEIMGGGGGFADFDGDGRLDVLAVGSDDVALLLSSCY